MSTNTRERWFLKRNEIKPNKSYLQFKNKGYEQDGGHEIGKGTFCAVVGKSQNGKNSRKNGRKTMKTKSELAYDLLFNTEQFSSGKTKLWLTQIN